MRERQSQSIADTAPSQAGELNKHLEAATGDNADRQAGNAIAGRESQGAQNHDQIEKHPRVFRHGVVVEAVKRTLHYGQQAVQNQHGQHEPEQKNRQFVIVPSQTGRSNGHEAGGEDITPAGQQHGQQDSPIEGEAENRTQLIFLVAIASDDRHEKITQHPTEEKGLHHFRDVIRHQKGVRQARRPKQRGLNGFPDKTQRPAQQRGNDNGAALPSDPGPQRVRSLLGRVYRRVGWGHPMTIAGAWRSVRKTW